MVVECLFIVYLVSDGDLVRIPIAFVDSMDRFSFLNLENSTTTWPCKGRILIDYCMYQV